jgi:hypothetical protein
MNFVSLPALAAFRSPILVATDCVFDVYISTAVSCFFFFEQVVFFLVYPFSVLVPSLFALHSTFVFYISFLPFYFSRYYGCEYPSAVRVSFSVIERIFSSFRFLHRPDSCNMFSNDCRDNTIVQDGWNQMRRRRYLDNSMPATLLVHKQGKIYDVASTMRYVKGLRWTRARVAINMGRLRIH